MIVECLEESGLWVYLIVAETGQVLAKSAETYNSLQDCLEAAKPLSSRLSLTLDDENKYIIKLNGRPTGPYGHIHDVFIPAEYDKTKNSNIPLKQFLLPLLQEYDALRIPHGYRDEDKPEKIAKRAKEKEILERCTKGFPVGSLERMLEAYQYNNFDVLTLFDWYEMNAWRKKP